MNPAELREEITIELEAMETTVKELLALHKMWLTGNPRFVKIPRPRYFHAQFYNGLDNVLKRISHLLSISLPIGETWHVELFQRFSAPAYPGLPQLFDEAFSSALAPYRRFRHVAFHSYGFQLDWNRMREGINNVQDIFNQIKDKLSAYLQSIDG